VRHKKSRAAPGYHGELVLRRVLCAIFSLRGQAAAGPV
jgi:hypothetical protein